MPDFPEPEYPTSLIRKSGSWSSCKIHFAAFSAANSGCKSTKRQKTSGHSTLAVLINPESPLPTAPNCPDPIPSSPSKRITARKKLRLVSELPASFKNEETFFAERKACLRNALAPSSSFDSDDAEETG